MPTSLNLLLKKIKPSSHQDPERDWIVLLIVSIIMLTGIVVWNAWAFDTIAKGNIIGSVVSTTPAASNQSSFGEINTIFEKRATEETNYTSGVYQYVDPSL